MALENAPVKLSRVNLKVTFFGVLHMEPSRFGVLRINITASNHLPQQRYAALCVNRFGFPHSPRGNHC